jgi:hypothetical protein
MSENEVLCEPRYRISSTYRAVVKLQWLQLSLISTSCGETSFNSIKSHDILVLMNVSNDFNLTSQLESSDYHLIIESANNRLSSACKIMD